MISNSVHFRFSHPHAVFKVPLPHSGSRRPSNTHPCQSDIRLTKRLSKLQALGVAASTRRTYKAGVKSYLFFCQKHDIAPLPASELTLRYFCTDLSQTLSPATTKVYLTRVRLFHIKNNFSDPTKEAPCFITYVQPSSSTKVITSAGDSQLQFRCYTLSSLFFSTNTRHLMTVGSSGQPSHSLSMVS